MTAIETLIEQKRKQQTARDIHLANQARAELEALRRKVQKLEALTRYAFHDPDCLVYSRVPRCSCGFWDAREAAK